MDYILSDEAARRLGISATTLRRLANEGKIKFYRLSPLGYRRYRIADLEAFITQRQTEENYI